MSDTVSIVLADDHALIRRGLVEVIGGDATFAVVGEAGDGATALALIERLRPRIAALDLQMPKMSGLEVAAEIRQRKLETKVVILTAFDSADMLDRALSLGAVGYLLKDSATAEIIACLHMVAAGRTYLSPAMSGHLVSRRASTDPGASPIGKLTPAEKRVLRLVAHGLTNDAIGAELHLSPKTVENHRTHMAARLGVRGANALLKFAVEHREELERV